MKEEQVTEPFAVRRSPPWTEVDVLLQTMTKKIIVGTDFRESDHLRKI